VDNQSSIEAAEDLWQQSGDALRAELGDAVWRTWLASVHPVGLEGRTLVLAVPNAVARQRIDSTYTGSITDAILRTGGVEVELDLVVRTEPRRDAGPGTHSEPPARAEEFPVPAILGPQPGSEAVIDLREGRDGAGAGALNPRYTFDQFVIGASNRFAHAAALSVAEKPSRSYNPLFVYGQSGLGKTHLLHAIGHHVWQMFPLKRVRYVSTETFMNEFVEAIRTNARHDFKRSYREVDLLLVDDVQFMQNHERLQEEFFHTFDSLHGSGGQIVLSSDRPPRAMATLEDRLRTRFEWGLLTDIQPPDFETRLAILRHKGRSQGFCDVPDDVLSFIATHIVDNVRELEGALIRVAAYGSLSRASVTEELARKVLADVLETTCSRVVTPQVILEETAKMFGWTIEELCGKSRRRPLVTARQIGMYVFRELTEYSYPQIAREFGGRDHTTVMHAVEKITGLMAERRTIFNQVSELINRIKSGDAP
jgi:chromosomal replication initiator protein